MKQPNSSKTHTSAKQMADVIKKIGTSVETLGASLQKLHHSAKQMKKK